MKTSLINICVKSTSVAYANANIALVKYWGKINSTLNIPAVSSLSMTLHDHGTVVQVSQSSLSQHSLLISGKPANNTQATTRLIEYLEQVRILFPYHGHFVVDSQSNLPFASGLASSASFFAALALALDDILDLQLNRIELSKLARLGSGSSARSIFDGFSGLHGGAHCAHDDAFAFAVEVAPNLDLTMVLAALDLGPKPISSRDAMNITSATSPFFSAFVKHSDEDMSLAMTALKQGDFIALGSVAEHSALKMFATMWSAKPAINYWLPQSIALIDLVYRLRQDLGPIAFFTMDAGPHVKILCQTKDVSSIVPRLEASGLVKSLLCSVPGKGASVMKELP